MQNPTKRFATSTCVLRSVPEVVQFLHDPVSNLVAKLGLFGVADRAVRKRLLPTRHLSDIVWRLLRSDHSWHDSVTWHRSSGFLTHCFLNCLCIKLCKTSCCFRRVVSKGRPCPESLDAREGGSYILRMIVVPCLRPVFFLRSICVRSAFPRFS